MAIFPPKQRDFDQILLDLGQTITLRKITRTTDSDGRITNVSTVDTEIQAVVEEISVKKINLLAGGHYKVGDINFYINPDTDIELFDKVIWESKILGVKNIKFDQKVAGFYVLKRIHCIKDSDE